MSNKFSTVKSNASRKPARSKGLERLESRQFMAAHIVGDPTVYQTIQAAVDAAMPGMTVTVDAGTYTEQVYIGKTLTLRGAQAGKDARGNVRASTSANETIMTGALNSDGTRTSSFYIAANDVTIDGFTVQGQTVQGDTGAGLVIAPNKFGTHIFNNIVQNNVAGVFLANNSNTDAAILQFNLFRNNNNDGSNGGRAIYSNGGISGGNLTNVLIDNNAFISNYGGLLTTKLEGSIALESRTLNTQHYITITNNVFDYNGKGVLVYNADHIDIENNTGTGQKDQWSAVFRFEGGGSYVTIKGNTVFDNTGPAVRIDEKGFAGPNHDFVVTNNNFYNNSLAYTNHQSVVLSALNQYDGMFVVTNNWWGNATGPSGDGSGTGEALVLMGNAGTYSPWATSLIGTGRAPYYGLAQSTDGLIQFEDFDHGGEGIAYHDMEIANVGGQYRKGGTRVDIGTTNDVGGGYMITSAKASEWLKYTINAAQSGTYDIDFRVAAAVAGGKFHLMIDGVNATGTIIVPATGSTSTWATITKTGVTLSAGLHDVQLMLDANNSQGTVANFNWMQFRYSGAALLPIAPDMLHGSPVNYSSVNLQWNDNSSNETGFVVERKTLPYGTWAPIATTAADVTSFTDTTASALTTYSYRVRALNASGQSANSNEFAVGTPPQLDITYLSDLPFAGPATNGWGPIERDMTVGGSNANDGQTLTLNGVTYSKGLGTNAISDVSFTLGGAYGTFVTDVGVDDKQKFDGTVIFQVFADGAKIYDSGIMDPDSQTQHLSLSVAGVQTLRLHVDDAGDGPDFDHADWAGARLLISAPVVPVVPNAPTGLLATAISQTQINLAWVDVSGETSYSIQRSLDNVSYTEVAGVAGDSTSYSDMSGLVAGTHYYYRIVATNAVGSSGFSNVADATTTPAPVLLPPNAPSSLVATAVSQTQINLTWTDNASDELNFILERSTDGVNFVQIATPAMNATTVIDSTGLLPSTSYTYRLRAVNAIGQSANSNIATATTLALLPTVPSAPTNLVATAVSQTQVIVNWTDNASDETGFVLERSQDGVNFTQIATPAVNATSYIDSGLAAGTSYSYRVRAINAAGPSIDSNIGNVITQPAPVATAPNAPSNLVATLLPGGSIKLTWVDNASDETNFILERSDDTMATWVQIATPAVNTITTTDGTTAAPGATIYYRIRAGNDNGASANSNIASVTIPQLPQPPAAPSSLVAVAMSPTQINLTWADNASDETGFIVERSNDGVNFTQIATPAVNATSYNDANGLVAGTKFYYRVRAINTAGASANSPIASATTLVPPPSTALPAGWTDGDLGTTGKSGSATYLNGLYTVNGAGAGFGKTSDAVNFASTAVNGDATITVHVSANSGTSGIMMRDGTGSGAKFVSITVGTDGKIVISKRTSTGGNMSDGNAGTITTGAWLRLVRVGNSIQPQTSANGTKWANAGGKINITFNSSVNTGLIVTSKSTSTLATAKFDNVSLILG